MHFADEMLEHFLGVGEIGDDAVFHRAHHGQVARRAAQHLLGIGADRGNGMRMMAAAVGADGDHRRLIQDDALAAHVDKGIGCSEIDGQVVGKEAAKLFKHQEKP